MKLLDGPATIENVEVLALRKGFRLTAVLVGGGVVVHYAGEGERVTIERGGITRVFGMAAKRPGLIGSERALYRKSRKRA